MNTQTSAPSAPIENLAIGTVIDVDGGSFVAELSPKLSELTRVYAGEVYPIGQFGSIVRIHFGTKLIYGMVTRLRMKAEFQAERGIAPTALADERIIEADLFGEGYYDYDHKEGKEKLVFERGVSNYPLPQQNVYLTPTSELQAIYSTGERAGINLGKHVGGGNAECFADLNELVGKHTAILGATGTGKSGATAAVIHSILSKRDAKQGWTPQIVILDPHGEYSSAFSGAKVISTDDNSMSLPFWLLDFQESINLFIGKTEHEATSQTNIVKNALLQARQAGGKAIGLTVADLITVDSPVPYKLPGFKKFIEDSMPTQPSKQDSHRSILSKIETLERDARLKFMMADWDGEEDPLPKIIQNLIEESRRPCIIDLSGVPNEIAGIASAMIARTLFNFKVRQTQERRQNSPMLLVCEEAHRYVPNTGEAQYEAARNAIQRIAKEGRKYGIGLFLISQRPGEVDATVLSQCNSWIVLRITNSGDKDRVRGILPDSMSGMTNMLSGLRRQEALFVGQATTLPSRIRIRDLSPEHLPRSNDIDFDKGWQNPGIDAAEVQDVIKIWRYQGRDDSGQGNPGTQF